MTKIDQFSDLRQVKLMKPGVHNGKQIDVKMLELMALSTMKAIPYLNKSIELQEYPGNPGIDLKGKPIPALLNLNHQEDFPEIMLNALKGVKLDKMYLMQDNGETWLTADYSNVPKDFAKIAKTKYPSRSVEILPPIYDPNTQTILPYVVRSTALLDATMPPAVKGQKNDFVVMYNSLDSQGIEIFTIQTEEPIMEKELKTGGTPTPPGQEIAEFKAALEAQKKEYTAMMAAKDKEIQALQAQFRSAREQAERQSIDAYCDALILQHGAAPAALNENTRTALMRLDNGVILEFSEGTKMTEREFWLDFLQKNVTGSVPIGQFAARSPLRESTPKSEEEQIAEYREQAQKMVNPSDERAVYLKQVELWTAAKRGGK